MIRSLARVIYSEYFVLWLCVAFYAIAAITIPGFASGRNALNILAVIVPLLILATGQTVVVLTGGIDLSIMSVVALTGVGGALLMSGDGGIFAQSAWALPLGLLFMIALGMALGAANGVCVAALGMPAFIVTLVTMMLASGVAVWITQSKTYHMFPPAYVALGQRLPIAIAIGTALAASAHLVLTRTAFGAWLYAVGQNARTARVSGVPVRRVLVAAYVFSGLCAALAAILLTGRLESASPVLGKRMLLDVIGATVIGGTSLYGGFGKITWTVFGVTFLAMIDNSLNLIGASFATTTIAKGGIILLAALLDTLKRRNLLAHG